MSSTTIELEGAPHVGDVGVALVVAVVDQDDAVVNIAAATELTVYLTKPDNTTLTKTAVLDSDGSDGLMKYVTIAGDLSVKGTWRIQGYVAGVNGFSGSTREQTFQVLASRHG